MRITCNTEQLIRELEQFHKDAVKRMTAMVIIFAYSVTLSASQNTPVGDAEALAERESYRKFYLDRYQKFGIEVDIGFHAGAWQYSESATLPFDKNIYSEEEAAGQFKQEMKSQYRLGETFFIGARGPAFALLENGYSPKAPEGIMQPTMQDITNVFSLNLAQYYKEGRA